MALALAPFRPHSKGGQRTSASKMDNERSMMLKLIRGSRRMPQCFLKNVVKDFSVAKRKRHFPPGADTPKDIQPPIHLRTGKAVRSVSST